MRIISQDGRNDVPYEMVRLEVREFNTGAKICAKSLSNTNSIELGAYSSMDKTQAVMIFLRKSFMNFDANSCCKMPQDMEVDG